MHVSSVTRARVKAALEQLNHRPNVSARNLRYGRTGFIALVLPELDLPYFAELARSVIKAAEPHGWTVLIDQTDGLPEREQLVLAGIRGHLLDGLIFSPIATGSAGPATRRRARRSTPSSSWSARARPEFVVPSRPTRRCRTAP